MDISIIIVNYNTKDITRQCLDSIFEKTKDVQFEVIVVDNDSNDGSKEMLSKYERVKYIQSGANLGFGKANNLGCSFATGRYILLLNSDTYLLNNAIKLFVDAFDKFDDSVGCIGCRLKDPKGNINHSFGKMPNLVGALRGALSFYLKPFGIKLWGFNECKYDSQEPFEVDYVMGADLCIRKKVIEKCGLFDPDFFMYYEESELQNRYKKNGFKSLIISAPQIVHLECASTSQIGKKYTYENRRLFFSSYILYMKKKYSFFKYVLFRIIFLLYIPIFFAPYYSLHESIKMIKMTISPVKIYAQNKKNL